MYNSVKTGSYRLNGEVNKAVFGDNYPKSIGTSTEVFFVSPSGLLCSNSNLLVEFEIFTKISE
jgi:hypothetical protein